MPEVTATAPDADFWQGVDPEIAQFEKDLRESVVQMQRGEFAAVHTPVQTMVRKRGRPRVRAKPTPKWPPPFGSRPK